MSQTASHKCFVCGGPGCEECDYKGSKYRAFLEVEGAHATFTGSGDAPSAETVAAMEELVRAAAARMEAAR